MRIGYAGLEGAGSPVQSGRHRLRVAEVYAVNRSPPPEANSFPVCGPTPAMWGTERISPSLSWVTYPSTIGVTLLI